MKRKRMHVRVSTRNQSCTSGLGKRVGMWQVESEQPVRKLFFEQSSKRTKNERARAREREREPDRQTDRPMAYKLLY